MSDVLPTREGDAMGFEEAALNNDRMTESSLLPIKRVGGKTAVIAVSIFQKRHPLRRPNAAGTEAERL